MELQINRTQDGVLAYPLHRHRNYEIMIYLEGEGYLHTNQKDYPFQPGIILIVPPGVEHGSVSKHGFRNIAIGGSFENLFHFKDVLSLVDSPEKEGVLLATMIYQNRHKNGDYLSKLCSALQSFLLQNIEMEDGIGSAVNQILTEMTIRFFDCDFKVVELLRKSGYAEDYIRSHFKKITGKSPNEFLTDIRIQHASFLIELYGSTMSLQEISQQSGYTDYIYFSKKFKEVKGMAPRDYKLRVIKEN